MSKERTYVMIATSSVKDLNFGDIGHKDAKQLRLNNDGGKCVVSYRGRQPRCVDGMREYNKEQMRAITNSDTNEWYVSKAGEEQQAWYNRVKSKVGKYNRFKDWF